MYCAGASYGSGWVAEQIPPAFVVAATTASVSFLSKDVKKAKQTTSTRLQHSKEPK